jgi:hypothetical protein
MSLVVLGQASKEKERHMSMESVHQNRRSTAARIACLVLITMVLGVSLASAAIYWDDELEPGNTGYPLVGGMSYSSNPVYSGSYSLKEHFLGGETQGGGFTDRYFGTKTDNLWSRYYLYLDNFVVHEAAGTKLMLQGSECCYPSFWWIMLFGKASLNVQVQGVNGGTETINVYGPAIPQNRWVCIETHLKLSSPGVLNGIVEAWIDGVQGIARYDVQMRDAVASGRHSLTENLTFNRLYVQFGGGDLYIDKLAFGDQRIGCSGNPPQRSSPTPVVQPPPPVQPTTPPAQPTLVPPPTPQGLIFR